MTIEKTEENQNSPSLDNGQAEARQWKKKEVIAEGFKNKTKGEAWFNVGSYVGVGYGLVTATSVFLTWLLNDTHKFAEKYAKFAGNVLGKLRIPPTFASIATLFVGGSIASVLPVKWLEDKKPEIVKKLDRMLYSDEELNSPQLKAAHKELDELPKQTWMSVLGSRIVAFAATVSVFALLGNNKSPLFKHFGESIDKLSIQFGRGFDRWLHKGNPEIIAKIDTAVTINAQRIASGEVDGLQALRGPGGDRIASRVWSYIGLDAFYTAITSASLFVFTRIFGGLIGKEAKPVANDAAPSAREQKTSTVAHDHKPHIPTQDNPRTKVAETTHHARINEPSQATELTA